MSVNPDAVPGAVNGLLGRFAAANAVAFPGTGLPRAHVTGTPVRPELASLDGTPGGRLASRAALGLPADRQTVACVGGSLGAAAGQPGASRSWRESGRGAKVVPCTRSRDDGD